MCEVLTKNFKVVIHRYTSQLLRTNFLHPFLGPLLLLYFLYDFNLHLVSLPTQVGLLAGNYSSDSSYLLLFNTILRLLKKH